MKHVAISEAETNLSSLVDQVEKGQEIVILRDGKPVAKLVRALPELTEEQVARRREAIATLREMARKRGLTVSHEEIKSWIEEGRH